MDEEFTVDLALDPDSDNPIANSVVTQAIGTLSSRIGRGGGAAGDPDAILRLSREIVAIKGRLDQLETLLSEYTDIPLTLTPTGGGQSISRLIFSRK